MRTACLISPVQFSYNKIIPTYKWTGLAGHTVLYKMSYHKKVMVREAAKKVFFIGIATKPYPPPLELSGKRIFYSFKLA